MTSHVGKGRSDSPSESALIAEAIAGDSVALERLLFAHYDNLERRIGSKLPARLQATHAVEDILQITFFQAFRDIRCFKQQTNATFGDWLARIAENRLYDAIKQHDRKKHGGDLHRVEDASPDDSRNLSLWNWIAAEDGSASSVVARDEALQALQVALAALPPDQYEAIRLKQLEGKSLEETATLMGRTPDAIRGLVHRAKQGLLATMGRASQWLKSK